MQDMSPSALADVLRAASITASITYGALQGANDRIETLERELATRPTEWAYEQACKALRHWREEAERLGAMAGAPPRQMQQET